MTKKTFSPPPIIYIALFFVLLGSAYWWFLRNPNQSLSDNGKITWLPNPINNSISSGERILITEKLTPDKQAGVEAFAKGDLKEAIAKLQSSLQQNPNDPEARIYLNNAKIGNSKALKIAISVPIGSNLNIAQEILRGAAQAQDEVNNSGGINGIPLKLVIADDRNKPEISAQVATEFTNDNTIIAVMGHNFSEAANAAAEIYQKQGLVAVFPTSGNVESDNKYIFRLASSTRSEANALAKYAKAKNLTKIAICADSLDRSSRSIKNEFTDYFQKNGGQIANTNCDFAANDFDSQLIMKQIVAEGANGILLRPNINRIEDATRIAQANQGGLQLMGTSTMYTKKTLDVQQSANGMVVSSIWHPDSNPRNLFGKNAEKLWNGPVSWRTATSYDSMQVIIVGLKQNSSFTRDGLQQFISKKEFSIEGVTGTVKFKSSGERDDENQIILLKVQPANSLTGYDFAPL
jgi:branched-chain amino acid transport system substrate-binding protein